jgi:hypothetical protein
MMSNDLDEYPGCPHFRKPPFICPPWFTTYPQGQEDLGNDRPGIYAVLRRAAVVPTARNGLIDGVVSVDL